MVPEITPGPEIPAPRALARWSALVNLSLPNLITLARLVSVPLMIWLIFDERYAAAFWVFVAAALSDALDGFVAKRFDRRTRLGAVLDPAADKTLLAGMYVTLGLTGQLPAWLVILVILRDVLIVLGWLVIQNTAAPRQLGPLTISKLNTLMQLALVGFILGHGIGVEIDWLDQLLILAVAVTTVWSGLSYLARCARLLGRPEGTL
jgi:cardiolipin synthase